PADATRLAGQLRRIETAARATGLQIEFGRRTKAGQPVALWIGTPPDEPPPNKASGTEHGSNSATPATPTTLLNAGRGRGGVDGGVGSGGATATVIYTTNDVDSVVAAEQPSYPANYTANNGAGTGLAGHCVDGVARLQPTLASEAVHVAAQPVQG